MFHQLNKSFENKQFLQIRILEKLVISFMIFFILISNLIDLITFMLAFKSIFYTETLIAVLFCNNIRKMSTCYIISRKLSSYHTHDIFWNHQTLLKTVESDCLMSASYAVILKRSVWCYIQLANMIIKWFLTHVFTCEISQVETIIRHNVWFLDLLSW